MWRAVAAGIVSAGFSKWQSVGIRGCQGVVLRAAASVSQIAESVCEEEAKAL